jgi:hypothetical protein
MPGNRRLQTGRGKGLKTCGMEDATQTGNRPCPKAFLPTALTNKQPAWEHIEPMQQDPIALAGLAVSLRRTIPKA